MFQTTNQVCFGIETASVDSPMQRYAQMPQQRTILHPSSFVKLVGSVGIQFMDEEQRAYFGVWGVWRKNFGVKFGVVRGSSGFVGMW